MLDGGVWGANQNFTTDFIKLYFRLVMPPLFSLYLFNTG